MRKNINFKYIISIENPEAYKDVFGNWTKTKNTLKDS